MLAELWLPTVWRTVGMATFGSTGLRGKVKLPPKVTDEKLNVIEQSEEAITALVVISRQLHYLLNQITTDSACSRKHWFEWF